MSKNYYIQNGSISIFAINFKKICIDSNKYKSNIRINDKYKNEAEKKFCNLKDIDGKFDFFLDSNARKGKKYD